MSYTNARGVDPIPSFRGCDRLPLRSTKTGMTFTRRPVQKGKTLFPESLNE